VSAALTAFETSVQPSALGRTFGKDFGSRKLEQDMKILDMPEKRLVCEWESCVKAAIAANTAVEEEIRSAKREHVCLSALDDPIVLTGGFRRSTLAERSTMSHSCRRL
jgi:hypothetical protein